MKITAKEVQFILYRLARKHGTFTGSRAWKVHNNESDYDYIVAQSIYNKMQKLPEYDGVVEQILTFGSDYEHDGNDTFYFTYKDKTINIICPNSITDNLAWIWANKAMKTINRTFIIDREKRISIFKSLRDLYNICIYDDVPF